MYTVIIVPWGDVEEVDALLRSFPQEALREEVLSPAKVHVHNYDIWTEILSSYHFLVHVVLLTNNNSLLLVTKHSTAQFPGSIVWMLDLHVREWL